VRSTFRQVFIPFVISYQIAVLSPSLFFFPKSRTASRAEKNSPLFLIKFYGDEASTSIFFARLCSRTGSWLRARCPGETPLGDGPRCRMARGFCWLRPVSWSASGLKFIERKAPHNGTQPWSSVTTSPLRWVWSDNKYYRDALSGYSRLELQQLLRDSVTAWF